MLLYLSILEIAPELIVLPNEKEMKTENKLMRQSNTECYD